MTEAATNDLPRGATRLEEESNHHILTTLPEKARPRPSLVYVELGLFRLFFSFFLKHGVRVPGFQELASP